ncbi:hypothetical protein SmJEL517_g00859 [Synchytrium microbalum]|uniref:U3 small nucleolar RNA-associated protein 11 n=1 Tax=Synchytrium microbalum TaxID=1806994 RepID=A0A507CHX9_9FUNG|nr:uncharacterized protein SmJEL517_g00859 [Synchytrium microbalum]TPX37223.1 hypothetical protein SmJEL517_g00859 [Synchytrium microbalum]
MSSSLRNSVNRRTHRERSQPGARSKLGLLEKHKDYVLRAKDYNSKQKRLAALRDKAYFRNPDEFYYKMMSTKTKGGVHIAERNEKFSHEFLKLLKTQDQNYVNFQRMVNQRKMDKLQSDIHIPTPNAASLLPPIPGQQQDEEETDDEDDNEEEVVQEPKPTRSNKNHIIFVEDADEAKSVAKSLSSSMASKEPKPIKRPSSLSLELAARQKRDEQLRKMQLEMDLQKNLMGKGARKKVGVDSAGLPTYKWRGDRKK